MANKFIDLFCGAGGLSLGLEAAGWNCVLAVDNWADAIATYRQNMPHTNSLVMDVFDIDPAFLSKHVNEDVDWIVGGPPCQGYSTVGRRNRLDPRNRLFEQFAHVVSIVRPKRFLIENVLGLRDMQFIGEVQKRFEDEGYSVTPMILRAADYGVPQLRRRVFFIGSSTQEIFEAPVASHDEDSFVTVWDAISDLPPLKPGQEKIAYEAGPETPYQRQLRRNSTFLQGHKASHHPAPLVKAISYIPDGGNRRDIPAPLQPNSGYHNSYSRLFSRAPAVAVTQNMGKPSGTRCIHPFQHRGLTAREGARLQGFPDTFHFYGGITSQRLQIANAVSPILADSLGQALRHEQIGLPESNGVERATASA